MFADMVSDALFSLYLQTFHTEEDVQLRYIVLPCFLLLLLLTLMKNLTHDRGVIGHRPCQRSL